APDEAREQVEGIHPGPLEIVKHEQRPCGASNVGQVALDGGEHEALLLLRGPGSWSSQIVVCVGELRQQACQPGAAFQTRMQMFWCQGMRVTLQRLYQRCIGLLAAAPVATAPEHTPVMLAGPGHRFMQQTRLADAWLPGEEHQWAPSLGTPVFKLTLQPCPFTYTPNQRRQDRYRWLSPSHDRSVSGRGAVGDSECLPCSLTLPSSGSRLKQHPLSG